MKRSRFTRKRLLKEGIPADQIEDYLDRVEGQAEEARRQAEARSGSRLTIRAFLLKQIYGIFCFKSSMAKHSQSTEKSILERIRGHGRGWVFTPRHFLDLASRPALTSALRRQIDAGTIRQLGRGLYDYPKLHPTLGQLSPTPDALAKAMAGRDRVRLQPSGAYAANLLGLSEQVPAKVVFLTDGPSRVVQIGPMTLQLRRTTPRNMAAAGRPSGLVIQAFRHLGPEHITPERIARLRRTLPVDDRSSLLKDLTLAPEWMHRPLKEIAVS